MSRYTEVQGEMTERRVEVTMAYLAEGRLDIVSTEPGNNPIAGSLQRVLSTRRVARCKHCGEKHVSELL